LVLWIFFSGYFEGGLEDFCAATMPEMAAQLVCLV
jgi:hypothetical protein